MKRFFISSAFLLLALTGCKKAPSIDWYEHHSYRETMDKAAKLGKPIFFEFHAEWCPYCARLNETLFQDPELITLSQKFFCVRVDGDKEAADTLMTEYYIKGYPTSIFTSADGTPLGAWQDITTASLFMEHLKAVLQATTALPSWTAHLNEALEGEELMTDSYFEEAEKHEEAGDAESAKATYQRGGQAALALLQSKQQLKSKKSLISGTLTLLIRGGLLKEASDLARRTMKIFPDDLLYPYKYAQVFHEKGELPKAVQYSEKALRLAYGRNKLWVANQLTEYLVEQGEIDRAQAIIQEVLSSINWESNTREKALKYKALLEKRLQEIS